MSLRFPYRPAIAAVVLTAVVSPALADTVTPDQLMRTLHGALTRYDASDLILEGAKRLFWSLAAISLVWTMGMLVVRQDIGEAMMEMLRFIVVTGIFYWLLINASDRGGGESFVDAIVQSFYGMLHENASDEQILNQTNGIMARGLHIFYNVMNETGEGDIADRIISGLMAVGVLAACAVMSAQYLLALAMAWILGYAGIFLLGFGGARWTSQIAINFYRNVVAIGMALLVLTIVGSVALDFLEKMQYDGLQKTFAHYPYLGMMLGASIVLTVLSIKVPQLVYTLVTGSSLGLFAGTASAAGVAIANAGSSAYAAAMGRSPVGDGGGNGGGSATSGGASVARTASVMDAAQRSASVASGMADPFHVASGSDPFGVPRSTDPHRRGGSVFGGGSEGMPTATDDLARAAGGRPADDAPWADAEPARHDDAVKGAGSTERRPARADVVARGAIPERTQHGTATDEGYREPAWEDDASRSATLAERRLSRADEDTTPETFLAPTRRDDTLRVDGRTHSVDAETILTETVAERHGSHDVHAPHATGMPLSSMSPTGSQDTARRHAHTETTMIPSMSTPSIPIDASDMTSPSHATGPTAVVAGRRGQTSRDVAHGADVATTQTRVTPASASVASATDAPSMEPLAPHATGRHAIASGAGASIDTSPATTSARGSDTQTASHLATGDAARNTVRATAAPGMATVATEASTATTAVTATTATAATTATNDAIAVAPGVASTAPTAMAPTSTETTAMSTDAGPRKAIPQAPTDADAQQASMRNATVTASGPTPDGLHATQAIESSPAAREAASRDAHAHAPVDTTPGAAAAPHQDADRASPTSAAATDIGARRPVPSAGQEKADAVVQEDMRAAPRVADEAVTVLDGASVIAAPSDDGAADTTDARDATDNAARPRRRRRRGATGMLPDERIATDVADATQPPSAAPDDGERSDVGPGGEPA